MMWMRWSVRQGFKSGCLKELAFALGIIFLSRNFRGKHTEPLGIGCLGSSGGVSSERSIRGTAYETRGERVAESTVNKQSDLIFFRVWSVIIKGAVRWSSAIARLNELTNGTAWQNRPFRV